MPQIQQLAATYASQIFWLLITFGLLYFGIARTMLPKVGKVKAQEIMTELEIAPTRRLRGLGDRQRKALLEKFDQ